jgi:hypothetical protein
MLNLLVHQDQSKKVGFKRLKIFPSPRKKVISKLKLVIYVAVHGYHAKSYWQHRCKIVHFTDHKTDLNIIRACPVNIRLKRKLVKEKLYRFTKHKNCVVNININLIYRKNVLTHNI